MDTPGPDKPEFPISVTWKETGETDIYNDIGGLVGDLEEFDSSEDDATVVDAKGRSVRLELCIYRNEFLMELL